MAAEHQLMTDDLLRQIIGAGQVDLLVGVPRIDRPAEAPGLVRAVRACFRTHFPRQRAALLYAGADGAGDTTALVQRIWNEKDATIGAGLRTTHLMTAAVPLPEHDAGTARLILAAADLLQANAVVMLDPDAAEVTPDRLALFTTPIRTGQVDLVAPVYARPVDEGLLVTQLLRPLTRTLYGRDLREPLVPEFGCSARFASYCAQLDADLIRAQWSTHYWIAAEALAGPFTVRQAALGPRRTPAGRPRTGLRSLFQQVVSSAFSSIAAHAEIWMGRTGVETVPGAMATDSVRAEPGRGGQRSLDSFATDVRNLHEILQRILSPEVLEALHASADAGAGLPGRLWADIVGEFLLAHHHAVMLREHTVQALMPLYIARTGTFLAEHTPSPPEAVVTALDALCADFERTKPRVIDRWAQPAVR
jgi:hypothetical protein